ncbi:hypothetical protein pb186bvf_008147 [Paramecium bursaria]
MKENQKKEQLLQLINYISENHHPQLYFLYIHIQLIYFPLMDIQK